MEEPDVLPSVRWVRTFATRFGEPDFFDHDLRSMLTDNFEREDRRRLIGVPGSVGPDEYVDQQKSFADVGQGRPRVELLEVLGVRGDRHVAVRARVAYADGYTTDLLGAHRFDSAVEKCERLVIFDPDDVDSALAELDRLHAETEAEGRAPWCGGSSL